MGEWRRASAGKGGRSRGKGGRRVPRSVRGLGWVLLAFGAWCLFFYLYLNRMPPKRKADPAPPFDATRTAR